MKLIDSAILIIAMATLLFCSDSAYINAYMRVLLLDPDILSRDLYRILYNGFMLNLQLILLAPLVIAVSFHLYTHILDYISIKLRKVDKDPGVAFANGRKIVKTVNIKYWIFKKRKNYWVFNKNKSLIIYLYVIFMAVTSFTALMIFHEYNGRSEAQKIIDRIRDGTYPSVTINNNQILATLYCGTNTCAGLDIESSQLVYYQNQNHNIKGSMISDKFGKPK
jgi:hypothetical protein